MKQCSKCQRRYADDSMFFCLDDGTRLSRADDPQATLRYPPPALRETLPYPPSDITRNLPGERPKLRTASTRVNPLLITTVIVSALLLIVGGIALGLFLKDRDPKIIANQPTPGPSRFSSPTSSSPSPTPPPSVPPSGPLASQLVGKWKWGDEERVYFSDGTGTSWDKSKKSHDFTYSLDGDVLNRMVIGTTQCSTSSGKYRIKISGDSLTQTHIDSGTITDWKTQ